MLRNFMKFTSSNACKKKNKNQHVNMLRTVINV